MARLPDQVVERIKREISVERLAEARGIQLRRSGTQIRVGLAAGSGPDSGVKSVPNSELGVWRFRHGWG